MERMSSSEPAVDLWYAGYRSEPITVLEAWEAIGHDIGCNPSKQELLDSLRHMAAMCEAHGYDFPDPAAQTDKVRVSMLPLRRVLNALVSAPHEIRELQVTREPAALFADNPINVLIAEFNAALAARGGE
ncbi:hypothetical protein EGJ28_16300 [Stutzerimonas xanthomarina]|jgi:hypothetical protein|uniref:Uncharacterized protein n=2 Tax=Stutzerimonas xanthomarina TaxID=271420 RepID=A0A427DYG7_9GAMM|nr:hypothetical protein [Stutzerimonas frequens]MBK3919968.1 hypothetical protein [Stutzerimonas frequens]RRV08826.1 hypothetical protein EGJ28_16300 [Stutzerimonas xanthomarina]